MNRFITFWLTVIFNFNVYADCVVKNNSMDNEENTARIYFGKVSILPDGIQRVGSIIKTGVAPANSFRGAKNGDDTVMWECDAYEANKIHLLVAVNRNTHNSPGAGNLHGRSKVKNIGIENVYYTRIHRAGIKLIMRDIEFDNKWQKVEFENKNFPSDPNDANKILIMLKHIPPVEAKLYKLNSDDPITAGSSCALIGNVGAHKTPIDHSDPILFCSYPNGYVQLAGFSNSNIHDPIGKEAENNLKHMQAKNGFGYSMRNSVWVYNQATCWVTSNTGYVYFAPITKDEISNVGKRIAPFNVTIECNSGNFNSFGTSTNKTSMYFEISNNTYNLIKKHESKLLSSPINGEITSEYLITDNYGEDGYAKGVGISVSTSNGKQKVPFIYNPVVCTDNVCINDGWTETKKLSALKEAHIDLSNKAQKDGNHTDKTIFNIPFIATLEKLPHAKPSDVTTGTVAVSAKVTLRVN